MVLQVICKARCHIHPMSASKFGAQSQRLDFCWALRFLLCKRRAGNVGFNGFKAWDVADAWRFEGVWGLSCVHLGLQMLGV